MTNKSSHDTKDITFSDFCENNHIKPMVQDTVLLNTTKTVNPKLHKPTSPAHRYNDISFNLDQNSSIPLSYCNDGQRAIIKSMQRGKYQVIATIDLHNYTQAEAFHHLEELINAKNTLGDSCLKIIHGKGLNSPQQTSVLKLLVRKFLLNHPRLIAYTQASDKDGGDGVTLVKLKNNNCHC